MEIVAPSRLTKFTDQQETMSDIGALSLDYFVESEPSAGINAASASAEEILPVCTKNTFSETSVIQ